MNSQLHITLSTNQLEKLRIEAEELEVSVAELIRRKLADPPTDEEVLRMREIEQILIKNEDN